MFINLWEQLHYYLLGQASLLLAYKKCALFQIPLLNSFAIHYSMYVALPNKRKGFICTFRYRSKNEWYLRTLKDGYDIALFSSQWNPTQIPAICKTKGFGLQLARLHLNRNQ